MVRIRILGGENFRRPSGCLLEHVDTFWIHHPGIRQSRRSDQVPAVMDMKTVIVDLNRITSSCDELIAWCKEHCEYPWHHAYYSWSSEMFCFESEQDATEFVLTWC